MKVLLLVALCVSGSLAFDTCEGNCGINDGTGGCECNNACTDFGDCCSDYAAKCLSCVDRCGEAYQSNKPCQCNVDCPSHGNCCDDYGDICSTGGTLTDQDVIDFSEELYLADVNSVGNLLTVDLQPPGPLFTDVDPAAYSGPTISKLIDLRDNYNSDSTVVESDTAEEAQEKEDFLDAIAATALMSKTEQFMWDNDLIPTSRSIRDVIDEIFFTYYTRSGGPLGSNGFEHSFLGEIDDKGVKGFHNWISFSIDESVGEITYTQELDFLDIADEIDGVLMMAFNWIQTGTDYEKPISSMWIGSSPEYELALYTLCFFYKPNNLCDVSAGGVAYKIQTYTQPSGGKNLVGSAYPDIP